MVVAHAITFHQSLICTFQPQYATDSNDRRANQIASVIGPCWPEFMPMIGELDDIQSRFHVRFEPKSQHTTEIYSINYHSACAHMCEHCYTARRASNDVFGDSIDPVPTIVTHAITFHHSHICCFQPQYATDSNDRRAILPFASVIDPS